MKINITKNQYRKLIDVIYVGNMMINGIRNADKQIKEYEDLEQYIYSFAKDFGFEDLIQYENLLEEYIPTREFEDSVVEEYLEVYNDYIFWEELQMRLSKRDAILETNTGWVKNDDSGELSEEQFRRLLHRQVEIEEKYEDEFCQNGLDNITVKIRK
ncbi:hypothetical protein [Clostridium cellulovorans]|uniref:Uncharacterized protein n=1 Tax=Clostridium cellulovorans (strain ATCC 35296 / DSM 3052 / OCM 3 / 743B) TaxID=573061 RepID=D9SWN5_CLOC7|nr:hypothetical protein [Clostridium cellulovorans]ADL53317.1 hypothetical protein Clocel_3647 [Clostridium cellulovorans 743B]